jgi:FAD/FMN-containing dehydrogenase
VSKNSCGFRIDSVVREDKFLPHKILAASEGTLGLVTEAKLRIIDLPEHRCLLVLGFSDLLAAVSAVPLILKFSPVALEMIDHTVVSSDRARPGNGCVLVVEFAGKRVFADRQLESCAHKMKSRCSVMEYASDESSLMRIWGARKGALNSIMKLTVGSRKPIGLIEDTVVKPEDLPDHVGALLKEYSRNKLKYVMYGHVGDGNVHTRPIVDLASNTQMNMMEEIATRVFKRVARRGGTITGEHGDGISRLRYIPMVYGRPVMKLFEHVKEIFDPKYVLNPGKKIISRKLQ